MSNLTVDSQNSRVNQAQQTNQTSPTNTTTNTPRSNIHFSDSSPLTNQQSLVAPIAQNLLRQPILSRENNSALNQTSNNLEQTNTPTRISAGPDESTVTQAGRQSITPTSLQHASADALTRMSAINLSDSEQNILKNIHARDDNNRVLNNATISVREGEGGVTGLSAGDVMTVTTDDGQSYEHTLTQDNIYDLRFRENITNTASNIDWHFTGSEFVDLNNATTVNESRQYTDSSGRTQTETVLKQNDYWELVDRGGSNYLVMRQTGNNGEPIKASDAVNDIFNNSSGYSFDCSSPMSVLNLKATLDTIGAENFNANVGNLTVSSWNDPMQPNQFDGGFAAGSVRRAGAGEVVVNGVANLNGEYARYDPSQDGGDLRIGNAYYFEKPGDNSSALQGWNAIYMGKDNNGADKFWMITRGENSVNFNNDGSWTTDGRGGLGGHYLGAVSMSPDTNVLRRLSR